MTRSSQRHGHITPRPWLQFRIAAVAGLVFAAVVAIGAVPTSVSAQEGSELATCPAGFVADAGLGGLCVQYSAADQQPNACPDGALGVPGACYILVAQGPHLFSDSPCQQGELLATTCVIVGPPPVPGPSSCPVSATVFEDGDECYALIDMPTEGCPDGTVADPSGTQCRQVVELRPGALQCTAGFGVIDGACIRYEAPTAAESLCPVNTVPDDGGGCRKYVSDAVGAFFCTNPAAALNGASCVVTAGPGSPPDGDCPAGSAPNASFGGMCTTSSPASQHQAACPVGAFGDAGSCMTMVERQPYGQASCLLGVYTEGMCVITGDPPILEAYCPVSASVIEDGDECFRLIARPAETASCAPPYVAFGSVCRLNNTGTDPESILAFECPVPDTGEQVNENQHTSNGQTKIESCSYIPEATIGDCPSGTTPDPTSDDCRRPVAVIPAPDEPCAPGFELTQGQCIRLEVPADVGPQCPTTSVEDDSHGCRQPIDDAPTSYYCPMPFAAVVGPVCVVIVDAEPARTSGSAFALAAQPGVDKDADDSVSAPAVTPTPTPSGEPYVYVVGSTSSGSVPPATPDACLSTARPDELPRRLASSETAWCG